MRSFRRLWREWRVPAARLGRSVLLAGLGAVVLGSVLDRVARDGPASAVGFLLPEDPATASSARRPRAGGEFPMPSAGIDRDATGSIGRPIVLDPCTGAAR